MVSFNDDLKQSDLLTTNAFDLMDFTEKYENTLTEILQRHAPLKRRMITLRLSAPWYHEGIFVFFSEIHKIKGVGCQKVRLL